MSIQDSYSTGDVDCYEQVGGLVGYMNNGAILRSYATGTVRTSSAFGGGGNEWAGGLIGWKYYGTVDKTFATGTVSGCTSNCGGLIGDSEGAITNNVWYNFAGNPSHCYANADGGCTAQSILSYFYDKDNLPMSSWDFSTKWVEVSGDFPDLIWQATICGNGIIEGSETCDDSDTSSGDGCSAICTIESGWDCNGEPSTCLEEYSITEPVSYDGGMDLTDINGNSIGSTTTETVLQIRDSSTPKVEFTIDADTDLSLISVDDDSLRIVVSNLGNAPGVTSTHSLYVPDTGAGVYICPDAITLSAVAVDCSNVVTIASCPGTSGVYSCTDEGSYFKVTGLTGSGVGSTCNDCADCDTGLYCDLRDGTPTCKNSTLVAAVDCVDCVDNDADTLIDLDDPGCGGDSNGVTEIDGGGATIPEFNFVGYLLILVIAGIGLYFISRK